MRERERALAWEGQEFIRGCLVNFIQSNILNTCDDPELSPSNVQIGIYFYPPLPQRPAIHSSK